MKAFWQHLGLVALVLGLTVSASQAVTVTVTDGDPCAVMGAVTDNDGDGYCATSSGHGSKTSLYISTKFGMGGYHDGNRLAIAEYDLDPYRQYSEEPNTVIQGATLNFYFDDAIFPAYSPNPWVTQQFTVECYVDSANGVLDGADSNDSDASVYDANTDDGSGGVVASWTFQAGDVDYTLTDGDVVGIYGPDEYYPTAYGDDQFAIFGKIGFEIDVNDLMTQFLNDPCVTHVGFRWVCDSEGGYWTSMDAVGYLPSLTVDLDCNEPLTFAMQSTDSDELSGNHGGRPYHIFDHVSDEAICLSAKDWQGGHSADAETPTFPKADGVLNWDTTTDANEDDGLVGAYTTNENGEYVFVYENTDGDVVLVEDENDVDPNELSKVYFTEECSNGTLLIGNNGIPDGCFADRQYALMTEFNLLRANRTPLNANSLEAAYLEITVDDVVDMSLSGDTMANLPSLLYINAYVGDGVLNDFANAQADFERIDHQEPNDVIWLTLDGTADSYPITDYSIAYYRQVNPGTGEQLTLTIDVTDIIREQLEQGAEYAGFVLSGSDDGEFTLASVDLVDEGENYTPKLILETNLQ